MEEFQPLSSTTKVYSTATEWAWEPDSFDNCLRELGHASSILSEANHLALYRGQRNMSWLIDSTLARSLKQKWFGVPDGHSFNQRAKNTFELHRLLVSAVLWKFGHVIKPHTDLLTEVQKEPEFDALFELMKRMQQHPEKEPDWAELPGTPLVDWSLSSDIGLFFANQNRTSSQAGAVFILDAIELGQVKMEKKVAEILQILEGTLHEQSPGLPLLFCPQKQTKMLRATRQEARYFAHMDLRLDLSEIWRIHEQNIGKRVLLKLILPAGTEAAIAHYLDQKGLDENYVMVNED